MGEEGTQRRTSLAALILQRSLRRERRLPFHFVPRHDVSLLQGFDGVQAASPLVL